MGSSGSVSLQRSLKNCGVSLVGFASCFGAASGGRFGMRRRRQFSLEITGRFQDWSQHRLKLAWLTSIGKPDAKFPGRRVLYLTALAGFVGMALRSLCAGFIDGAVYRGCVSCPNSFWLLLRGYVLRVKLGGYKMEVSERRRF